MPDNNPPPVPDTSTLESRVAEYDTIIANETDRDGAMVIMAKGFRDTTLGLIEMVKGMMKKKDPEPDDDEDTDAGAGGGSGDGSDGGEKKSEPDDDEDTDAGGEPGYQDMRMGGGAEEEFVDVTDYVVALEGQVKRQGARIKSLRKAVVDGQAETRAMFAQLLLQQGQQLAPLNKGMIELRGVLSNLPAGGQDPAYKSRMDAAKHALARAQAGGGESGITKTQLAKGLQGNIFTDEQHRLFKAEGKFSEDEGENTTILGKVKAL